MWVWVIPGCVPHPVLWLGLAVLDSPVQLPGPPLGLAGDGETVGWQDQPSSELAVPTGRGGSGTEGSPAGSPRTRTRSLAWGGSANLASLQLAFAFLPGPACGPWSPTGLDANPRQAPNWLCDLEQVAPLSVPWFPLLEPACESIYLIALMSRVEEYDVHRT